MSDLKTFAKAKSISQFCFLCITLNQWPLFKNINIFIFSSVVLLLFRSNYKQFQTYWFDPVANFSDWECRVDQFSSSLHGTKVLNYSDSARLMFSKNSSKAHNEHYYLIFLLSMGTVLNFVAIIMTPGLLWKKCQYFKVMLIFFSCYSSSKILWC